MKLTYFDDYKLGVVKGDSIVDVSAAVADVPHTSPGDLINHVIADWDNLQRFSQFELNSHLVHENSSKRNHTYPEHTCCHFGITSKDLNSVRPRIVREPRVIVGINALGTLLFCGENVRIAYVQIWP